MHKTFELLGYLLVVDLDTGRGDEIECLICVYAPNDPKDRTHFFQVVFQHCNACKALLGDFNSVVDSADRFSGALDRTSAQLDF